VAMASEDTFPLIEAQIITTWMGAVSFGIMLVSSFICVRCLLSSDSALKPISFRILLSVAILMALIDGLATSLQLRHTLDAFVYYQGPGGPLELLNDRRSWINFVKTGIYTVQTWLGDGVMVYRCYVVFEGRWYVVIPSLILFVSVLATGFLPLYFTAVEGHGTITGAKIGPAILSFSLLSLAQNIGITVAISLRIYLLQRRMAGSMTSNQALNRLKRAMIIIVESGAIYSATMLLFVGTFISNNVTDYGWSGVIGSVIPISFNLIIIRVHRGRAMGNQTVAFGSKAGELSTVRFGGHGASISAASRAPGRDQNQGTNTIDVELGMVNTDSVLGTGSHIMDVSNSATKNPMSFNVDLDVEAQGEK